MKKHLSLLLAASMVAAGVPTSARAQDYRPTAIVVLGALTASGGLYLICKEKKSTISKIVASITGAALVAAGTASILMSKKIVSEVDWQNSYLHQAMETFRK